MSLLAFLVLPLLARPDQISVRVFNGAGEAVRTFPPVTSSRAPTNVTFSYTASGACATAASLPGEAFSPDGDCRNDILVVSFTGVTSTTTGQPVLWWDGSTDTGLGLSNGVYLVHATHSSTSAESGPELLASVTLASTRPPVRAAVSNAAGVELIALPVAAYRNVTRVRVDPPLYAPDLAGTATVAFDLMAADGTIVAAIAWNGKDRTGHVAQNGDYLFTYTVVMGDGSEAAFNVTFTISHGVLGMVEDAVLAPNPVAAATARVWLRYKVVQSGLTDLKLTVYDVAGERIAAVDAARQASPADPLDANGDGYGACFWDLTNARGHRVARGLYLVVLDAARADGSRQRTTVKLLVE